MERRDAPAGQRSLAQAAPRPARAYPNQAGQDGDARSLRAQAIGSAVQPPGTLPMATGGGGRT